MQPRSMTASFQGLETVTPVLSARYAAGSTPFQSRYTKSDNMYLHIRLDRPVLGFMKQLCTSFSL
ncbi:Protein of unknown function [Pyronema omphalodes CBS 100304]|uniref:Uncharacterized protein n=1 Tax=Pyronema omphalodes (strain CBS 100304) TaxID=1076935 RepID=U4LH88_PYROM|nr:Protein of unknown function [Pyronema omphalodes CBS 100304]